MKADVDILAFINTNTTSKSEAINHLINGIGVAFGKEIKSFVLLGKQINKIKAYVLPFFNKLSLRWCKAKRNKQKTKQKQNKNKNKVTTVKMV